MRVSGKDECPDNATTPKTPTIAKTTMEDNDLENQEETDRHLACQKQNQGSPTGGSRFVVNSTISKTDDDDLSSSGVDGSDIVTGEEGHTGAKLCGDGSDIVKHEGLGSVIVVLRRGSKNDESFQVSQSGDDHEVADEQGGSCICCWFPVDVAATCLIALLMMLVAIFRCW